MPDEDLPVKLSLPLEFQQDIFREVRVEDELVIIARGLGLLRIITNLLHSYDAAGNDLILLLGADERENGWIGEALAEHAAISNVKKCQGLRLVKADVANVGERELLYSEGGIFTVTSQILIVDFLSGLLKPSSVTGIVMLHAERVVATSTEAFILRFYRQHNKNGFLKAFSDQPEAFTSGFAPLANMMRNLFLRRPSLWPRFQVSVAKSLEGKKKAEVIELEVPMTDAMKDIQAAILECIDASIGELKKANTGLDMEDWNSDSALHRNFDQIVRRQLDPVWHRSSYRTRQIVRDLSELRVMLHALLTYDAVQFKRYVDQIVAAAQQASTSNGSNISPWLSLDAATTIKDISQRRVYTGKIEDGQGEKADAGAQLVLEELPKWATLSEVLREIEQDVHISSMPTDDSVATTLIMGGDQASCQQIRQYLSTMYDIPETSHRTNGHKKTAAEPEASGDFIMHKKFRSYCTWRKNFAKVTSKLSNDNQKGASKDSDQRSAKSSRGRAPPNKRRRMRGGAAAAIRSGNALPSSVEKDAHLASLMAELQPTDEDDMEREEANYDPMYRLDHFYELYDMKDMVMVHPYDGDMDEMILEEMRPRYVIMYEPDAAFIRRVEVYRSSHTNRAVRVYFMYYGESVEEKRYLSAVRREKDAFTKLIKERGSMAVTLTLDSQGIDDPQEHFLRTVNTRIAGGGRLAATASPPVVVIDVREFRSSLPSLLHGRSMIPVPCTLTVGDYVLTPNICVERKSLPDLFASLNSGRLYNQAETMLQHYKNPFLLIEFDQNKSFTLEPFADYSSGPSKGSSLAALNPGGSMDIQSKLVLLTLSFPRLKVIWSSSPYQTAEIFEELKKLQDEPDPLTAARVGLDVGALADSSGGLLDAAGGGTTQTFNQDPQDMLRAVPGMTEKNLYRITLRVSSIEELANMEESAISELVGSEAGRQIHRFFNRNLFDGGEEAETSV